ncbi:MAG: IS3 family transposase, partial [Anaerolineales bacterium]|nr:IS3 family transposase [Anaerolineales bacterium]
MKTKRKKYNAALKAKVGMEAILGVKTVGQIAREYQVHPTLVTQWRKVIRERLPELFEAARPGQEDQGELVAQLHQKIGELTVDLDWLKKKSKQLSVSARQELIQRCEQPSIRHQCELVGISRSGYYYEPCAETAENLVLMRRLDELHLDHLVYGSRRLMILLQREGQLVNRKRVVRLLRVMGIEAIYPRRRTSQPGEGHQIYPYLLKGLEISGPDQVWCSDITYVPMQQGFMYLVAVMDWWSRYVLAWELSNTLEPDFCIGAWERALQAGHKAPLISNTDQGSQFTSLGFVDAVESAGVDVSMDSRGRWMDNRFIERLWRSLKYEDIYLNDYLDGLDAGRGIGRWFRDYNQLRPHQSLGYATPADWYQNPDSYGARPAHWIERK